MSVNFKTRIDQRFQALKEQGRGGLVTFITAGDPDDKTSLEILKGLPGAGADIIELGMPFSDPMADGPAIQAASQRALKGGQTMARTLDMVRAFRSADEKTPIILMGYFNPIYVYGVRAFLKDAKAAGVDGLIVVDLPPEEESELCLPALEAEINFICLTTPTTSDVRLPRVLQRASGFVYYASIAGVTGTKSASADSVEEAVTRLRRHTDLPIAVGFGVKTAKSAACFSALSDAVVVGSALVGKVAQNLDGGVASPELVEDVLGLAAQLAGGVRNREVKGVAK